MIDSKIENTNEALLCEYYRLQNAYLSLHWSVMRGHTIESQLMDVEAELWRRGTLYLGRKRSEDKHLCQ